MKQQDMLMMQALVGLLTDSASETDMLSLKPFSNILNGTPQENEANLLGLKTAQGILNNTPPTDLDSFVLISMRRAAPGTPCSDCGRVHGGDDVPVEFQVLAVVQVITLKLMIKAAYDEISKQAESPAKGKSPTLEDLLNTVGEEIARAGNYNH